MKTIEGQEVREMLKELYWYYFKESRKFDSDEEVVTVDDAYKIGGIDGNANAICVIYLQMFGGQAMYELLLDCMRKADADGI